MKRNASVACPLTFALFLSLSAAGQAPPASTPHSNALEKILDRMDKVAADFRTTEASFVWEQYTRVVNDTDTQKGRIYFRRSGGEIQMAADITEPAPKYVVFANGKIQLYQPRTGQITSYDTSKNRAEVESFLVLGFGGGGHAMLKSFDVQYLGSEKVDGVDTAKLDLVPKSQKARSNIPRILLWIDPQRGISVQQQIFQPGGDYRMALYDHIEINQKIPDSVFKIKNAEKATLQAP
jgi:outer membrane lipoprotein-sorting protein